ncbi:hypothetical protein BOG92_044830 [Streptomyces sp. WAC00263]|nr:hypothetical protein BOG92_044830 [Streptomyces sp. WAC00263]
MSLGRAPRRRQPLPSPPPPLPVPSLGAAAPRPPLRPERPRPQTPDRLKTRTGVGGPSASDVVLKRRTG